MSDLHAVCVLNGYLKWLSCEKTVTLFILLFISIFARYKLEIVGGMGSTVGKVSRLAIN